MSDFTLLSWNVNGLRAAYKKGFLEWLRTAAADVVCLQEVKASEAQLPPELKEVPGYYTYFGWGERPGYSGVALYTNLKPRSVRKGMGRPQFDGEGRILIAAFHNFLLYNVYFPNGQSGPERLAYKLAFYDAFLEEVDAANAAGQGIIVCGDFNTAHKELDLARPKENVHTSGFLPQERAWLDKFVDRGFYDTFRLFNAEGGNYTYWDQRTGARERNVGWRIDYFFVNEKVRPRVRDAFILPEVMGSDHCPVGLTLRL